MINYIVIHCSDSPDDRDVTAEEIHRWHTAPPRNWAGIGYHHVIRRDGTIEAGRPEYWEGAHVKGHNHESIGICMVGRHDFTDKQFDYLEALVRHLQVTYPQAKVVGHRDLDPRKTCPNFDVGAWLDGLV